MGVASRAMPPTAIEKETVPIVVSPDPSAAGTPWTALYVWESLEQPGDYALCTDPQHRDFQNANWRFRGELAAVPELDGLPRPTIDNGWPMRVHRGHPSGDDRMRDRNDRNNIGTPDPRSCIDSAGGSNTVNFRHGPIGPPDGSSAEVLNSLVRRFVHRRQHYAALHRSL